MTTKPRYMMHSARKINTDVLKCLSQDLLIFFIKLNYSDISPWSRVGFRE